MSAGNFGEGMMAGDVCHVLGGCAGITKKGSDLSTALTRGEVVIVDVDLNRPVETIEGHSDFLSEAEQCRAREYVRDRDRIHFIRRRIVLRRFLGDILGLDPRSIVIRTDPSGKPFVAPEGRSRPLSFSMSHSRGRAIYAFAKRREVGIDLEFRDPAIDVLKMARVLCTPAERDRLMSLPVGDRLDAFYDCWCTKEAFIKVAGVREPTSFEVSFWPEKLELVGLDGKPTPFGRWSFHRMDAGADWSVVLAIDGGSLETNDGGLTWFDRFRRSTASTSSS
jgi:4'-phosphopantetheinyl transferase